MMYSSMKHESEHNLMTLTGNGQVTAVPDTAVLRLGVQTNSDNVTEAQQENAKLSQSIIQSLHQAGVTNIKTYQYSIDKVYEYDNNQRIDKGYSVRNILEIRTSDMDQVGAIIDLAVNRGANVIDLVNFEVSDPSEYYLHALNLAVMDAYEKARSIADHLGILTQPIPKHIQENSAVPTPYRNLAAREGAFTTPIEPGNLQIDSSVTVDFIF